MEGMVEDRLVVVCSKLPESFVRRIDETVKKGLFISRSEFVRYAVREQLIKMGLITGGEGGQ